MNIIEPDTADPEVVDETETVDPENGEPATSGDRDPDVSKADAAKSEDDDPADADEGTEESATTPRRSAKSTGRRVSVSLRSLVVTAIIVALLASVGVLAWLYVGAKSKLDENTRQADAARHAEQIALDYAVGAAQINYQDLGVWKANLVKGATAELKDKLNSAGTSMEQILTPLQWNSTATPLIAKVRSDAGGIYVVDAFVGVQTKTVQAPDGLQSTATYSVTMDSNHNWEISDVGGIGAVIGNK